MPTDAYRTGGEYFHECLIGICEEASARDYDIMITDVTWNDYTRKKVMSIMSFWFVNQRIE